MHLEKTHVQVLHSTRHARLPVSPPCLGGRVQQESMLEFRHGPPKRDTLEQKASLPMTVQQTTTWPGPSLTQSQTKSLADPETSAVQKAYVPKKCLLSNAWCPELVTTYLLTKWDGTPLEGQFYEEGVLLVTVPDNVLFLVKKIMQRHGTQVKVRWMGWPSKYNSWIPKSALTQPRNACLISSPKNPSSRHHGPLVVARSFSIRPVCQNHL